MTRTTTAALVVAVVGVLVGLLVGPPPPSWYSTMDASGRRVVDARTMADERSLPLWTRAVGMATRSVAVKRWVVPVDVRGWLVEARAAARSMGVSDTTTFWVDEGEALVEGKSPVDDPDAYANTSWMRMLRILVDEMDNDVPTFSLIGRIAVREAVVKALVTQLRINDLFRKHPEIENERVERPVVVAGPQRTMTTHTQFILSQHPDLRGLMYYEALDPLEPVGIQPEHVGTWRDERVRMVWKARGVLLSVRPWMESMIKTGTYVPAEDVHLTEFSLNSPTLEVFSNFTKYATARLVHESGKPALRWLKKVHKVMQWQETVRRAKLGLPKRAKPRRFIMKTPEHAYFLKDLFEVYPDAYLVLTHRDVPSVLASYVPMLTYVSGVANYPLNVKAMAQYVLKASEIKWHRLVDQIDVVPKDRVLMVPFREYVKDNLAWTRKMLELAGLDASPSVMAKIKAFIDSSPREGANTFAYKVETFGEEFEASNLRKMFAKYEEKFGAFV